MAETLIAPAAGMINLAPGALKKVQQLLAQQGNPEDLYLRLGAKGGGCSGYSYVLEFDRDVDEKYDRFFEFEGGVKVVIDRKSLLLLAGTTLDYSGDLLGQGFEFKNPNVKRGCGCGTSFQV